MKKIFLFLFALGLTYMANAQVTATFQVDVTNLVAGTPIAPAGMRVGGTFGDIGATNGSFTMVNWTPGDTGSKMIDLGGNVWQIAVTFPSAKIGDTLYFKFIDGTWDPTGTNEGYGTPGVTDPGLVNGGCGVPTTASGNVGNRLFVVPQTAVTYKWCYDSCKQCNGSDALLTGVQQFNKNISVFSLAPNPAANKQTTLIYSVSEYSPVNISVYNVLGQSVKTIVNTNRPSGVYNQPIDLNGLNTGVYFIQLKSGNQTVTRKITL